MGTLGNNNTRYNGSMYLNCSYASLYVVNTPAFEHNTIAVGVVNVIFSMPTILLNVLVLNAFIRKKKLRKSSNMILFSLSVTDLMSGLFIQPFLAISLFVAIGYKNNPRDPTYPCWVMGISGIGGYILATISLATVSFISLERYVAIFHPFMYTQKITSKVIKRTCASLWVVPIIFVLVLYLVKAHEVFFWINGVFILLVYIWNIFIYIRISRQVYNVRRELRRLHSRFSSEKTLATQSKVTQVAGSIIVALLMCYLPQVLMSILRLVIRKRFIVEYLEYWTISLALISPCLNPLFYCYYNSEIRKEVFFFIKYLKKEKLNNRQAYIPKPAVVNTHSGDVNARIMTSNDDTPKYISSEQQREEKMNTSEQRTPNTSENTRTPNASENIRTHPDTSDNFVLQNVRVVDEESSNIGQELAEDIVPIATVNKEDVVVEMDEHINADIIKNDNVDDTMSCMEVPMKSVDNQAFDDGAD